MKHLFHQLPVIEKAFLTDSAVLLTFQIPEELKESFSFLPGQYITLKAMVDGEEQRRSYSICTNPWDESRCSVVIKAINNGIFSNYIKNHVQIGDILEVGQPEGRFLYQTSSELKKNIFLMAAGSGITPIISIINTILFKEQDTKAFLLYANKTIEDAIFFKELELLKAKFPDRFTVNYIFSRNPYKDFHFGRVDQSFLDKNVKNQVSFEDFSDFYSCGPEGLVRMFHNYLEANGVAKEKMKHELFFSEESGGVMEASTDNSDTVSIKVILDAQTYHIHSSANANLLEILLDNGIEAPYSCKKGNCSSCVGKVISGKVDMNPTDILMDYEIEEGFILSCQCTPASKDLVISYDEY